MSFLERWSASLIYSEGQKQSNAPRFQTKITNGKTVAVVKMHFTASNKMSVYNEKIMSQEMKLEAPRDSEIRQQKLNIA